MQKLKFETVVDREIFGLYLLRDVQAAAQAGDAYAQTLLDNARQDYEGRHGHE